VLEGQAQSTRGMVVSRKLDYCESNARPSNKLKMNGWNTFMALHPELNGAILYDPTSSDPSAIYWIDSGTKRHIVDEDTYNGVFGGHDKSPKTKFDLGDVDLGNPVAHGDALVQELTRIPVLFFSEGILRWIETPEAFTKYHFHGTILTVPTGLLNHTQAGPPFTGTA
jgi:hypothetical protein